jgi:hypothetical protein
MRCRRDEQTLFLTWLQPSSADSLGAGVQSDDVDARALERSVIPITLRNSPVEE